MLVHAHPDDESINNGATMARYVDEGAQVTLVTCTLGEEGEVLVPDLHHLAADHGDELGEHRLGELTDAMACLGVTDFVRLGGDHRFRDSGMAWADDGTATARDSLREGIFWTTDLLVAANELVSLIRDRRPQVLITYNEIGGYGHPDHVQAHRVAMYGYQLAGMAHYRPDLGEAWQVGPRAVDDHEREPSPRGAAGAAGFGGHRDLRRDGPGRAVGGRWPRPTRRSRCRSTAARGSPASWTRCARTPPRSPPTASSSVARRSSATRCGRRSSTGSRPARRIPDGDGWADDVFAGLDLAG